MWTKAEIAKLTVEQQEVLARFELSIARQRQKLLEQARGLDWRSRYWPIYSFAAFMILIAFYYFDFLHFQEKPSLVIFFASLMFVNGLIFHIARTNRRLDALLELQDFDRQHQDGNDSEKGKAD